MERYDYLSYRVIKSFMKDKMAVRFKKETNVIDDIDELDEAVGAMYKNFKYKNSAIILLNLSVFDKSIQLISRDYGGGVSDVNLMRIISKNIKELIRNLKNLTTEEEFNKYKNDLRKKIHLKIKKLA